MVFFEVWRLYNMVVVGFFSIVKDVMFFGLIFIFWLLLFVFWVLSFIFLLIGELLLIGMLFIMKRGWLLLFSEVFFWIIMIEEVLGVLFELLIIIFVIFFCRLLMILGCWDFIIDLDCRVCIV